MQYIDCYINPISRQVSYPGAVIVQRDTNVEVLRFHFALAAQYELENDSIRVMVMSGKETRGFNAENVRTETNDGGDEELVFEHTITRYETEKPGQINVSVCGNKISGDTITEAWHTLNMAFQVSGAIHTDSDEGEDSEETAASNAEKIAALQTLVDAITSGRPIPVDLKSKMVDTSAIYLYTGNETGEQHNYWYYHDGTSWVPGSEYGGITVDDELSATSENPVQNKVIKANFDQVNGRLTELEQGGTGGGMTEEAKQALLNLVSHIGLWDDEHGQDYIDALEAALYPPASLTRITAVYTQSGVVYEGSELNNLKADLVVTAIYSDSTTEVIAAYTLTGTLEEGTSTITVSYGGKTTTFDVTVTGQLIPSGYQQLEYVYSDGGVYFESLVKPTAYPIRIEMGIYKASQANAEQAIICKKVSSSSSLEVGYNATANTLFAYSGASAKVTDPVVYGNVIDVVAEFNGASPYKTLDVTADEETLTAENTTANNVSILANSPLYLFGSGLGSLYYVGRMYYCKVYSGGELIGDFIPCYDKETGYAGMYETVGGNFHYSQGAGGFKRGGEV